MTQLDRRDYAQLVAANLASRTSGDLFTRKSQDNPPGLSAGIWTESYQAALKAGGHFPAGTVWVYTRMDGFAEMPFGGARESGIGRDRVLKQSTSSPRRSPSSPIGVRVVCGSRVKGDGTPMTLLFAIVGDPVAQVRSPEVFNRLFDERGVDASWFRLLVRPSGFAASLSGLRKVENLAGLIVTVPHKASAAQLLNKASSRVKIANASNVLRPCLDGWEGDLFDGEGFAQGMEAEGHVLEGAHCALVGCGGAGAAIALALLERDVASLSIWDIDQARAADLAQRLRAVTSVEISVAPPDAQSDVAINATPLGMDENDPVPFFARTLEERRACGRRHHETAADQTASRSRAPWTPYPGGPSHA